MRPGIKLDNNSIERQGNATSGYGHDVLYGVNHNLNCNANYNDASPIAGQSNSLPRNDSSGAGGQADSYSHYGVDVDHNYGSSCYGVGVDQNNGSFGGGQNIDFSRYGYEVKVSAHTIQQEQSLDSIES